MSLITIRALISCDECGRAFSVELDPAEELSTFQNLYEIVEEAITNSFNYDTPNSEMGFSSVQTGKMLCHECTIIADKVNE